jgi:NAD(P)-dependent dehydrogenase (short-subunit alcohol dehydrogenase family)
MRLKDKLAVITAAASGMGRAGVELFAREGATVAAVDINAAALKAVVSDVNAKEGNKGGKVIPIVSDLSTVDGVRQSVGEAAAALGGIDVMWANASTPGPAAVEGLAPAEYEKAMALNVTSAVFAAGEVVQHMRRRGGGSLVFTASVSGLVGSMFSPVYSAGKFAVVGLTKSLAQRFAADRVRVNVVCPGPIDTPMLPGFIGRSDDKDQMAQNQKKLMAAVPLGRIGRPEEVAHAVLWLASDDTSYVTGISLPVDGGLSRAIISARPRGIACMEEGRAPNQAPLDPSSITS